jgi:hypothetical protein
MVGQAGKLPAHPGVCILRFRMRTWTTAVMGLLSCAWACACARPPAVATAPQLTAGVASDENAPAAVEWTPPARSAERWMFESLSPDGKRALLRELAPKGHATFHVRAVDVETGRTIEDVSLPELAKIPSSTIGGEPTALAALEWMLASGAFSRDIVKGARTAATFPFGECGRLAAAPNGAAIAFDAGDWLYVADESGRVQRRVVDEAAYDPRFTPDGKHILFRRAVASADVLARYELFVVPSDLSSPPRALPSTYGIRGRFVEQPDGQSAVAIASQHRGRDRRGSPDTCVVSVSLRSPFPVKRLACIDGNEQLVESALSPKAKWAALSTKARSPGGGLAWRLRVLSLTNGKVVLDEPDVPGLTVRAISDTGLLVRSGVLGAVVEDVPGKKRRELDGSVVDHRGAFRNDKELVYLAGSTVAVLDVTKE